MAIHEEILDRGGQVVAYSAQPQRQVNKLRENLGLEFIHCLSDPEHKLRNVLKEDELIDIFVTNRDKRYPNGRLEPSLLVLNDKQEVMFQWRIVPSISNIGGASDRPSVSRVFEVVKRKLDGEIPLSQATNVEDVVKELEIKVGVTRAFSPRVIFHQLSYALGELWKAIRQKKNNNNS